MESAEKRDANHLPAPDPIVKQIEGLLKKRYQSYGKVEDQRYIDGIQGFITRTLLATTVLRVLQDATRTVHSLFGFQEVSVGLRDDADNNYRYLVFTGYSKEAEAELRKFTYTYDEFFSQREFPSIRISKALDINIGDTQPAMEREKKAWNRPTQLGAGRSSPENFTEKDYIDVFMYEPGNELLGWLEVSAPRDGKMPSGELLRGLELFSSVLSLAIQRRGMDPGPRHEPKFNS